MWWVIRRSLAWSHVWPFHTDDVFVCFFLCRSNSIRCWLRLRSKPKLRLGKLLTTPSSSADRPCTKKFLHNSTRSVHFIVFSYSFDWLHAHLCTAISTWCHVHPQLTLRIQAILNSRRNQAMQAAVTASSTNNPGNPVSAPLNWMYFSQGWKSKGVKRSMLTIVLVHKHSILSNFSILFASFRVQWSCVNVNHWNILSLKLYTLYLKL